MIEININIETLIPFERIQEEPDEIFKVVDIYGQAVLLKNNAPAYIIMKPQEAIKANQEQAKPLPYPSTYTLQEAMRIVLWMPRITRCTHQNLPMLYVERFIYTEKRRKGQIQSNACKVWPLSRDVEALKGNIIRLRIENEETVGDIIMIDWNRNKR